MTLNEIAKEFPLGSLVIGTQPSGTHNEIGIILGHREAVPNKACVRVGWMGIHDTFELNKGVFPEEIKPYGEIDAVETLIDFAGRLLETDLGKPDREKLESAIGICEGAFGL